MKVNGEAYGLGARMASGHAGRKSPLGELIARHGVPVPLALLYRANTTTRAEFERMSAEAELAEKRRRAQVAREIRQMRIADEWSAGKGDGDADRR